MEIYIKEQISHVLVRKISFKHQVQKSLLCCLPLNDICCNSDHILLIKI